MSSRDADESQVLNGLHRFDVEVSQLGYEAWGWAWDLYINWKRLTKVEWDTLWTTL
jgi:hypothetical protein